MSLVLSTGSNLGDRKKNLELAKIELEKNFCLREESSLYESKAVDYLDQGDFLNQVLVFDLPSLEPEEVLKLTMSIEKQLGRVRNIDKGPRTIDIDLLFWSFEKFKTSTLTIPHPRLFERSFIVLPLRELNFYSELEERFSFSDDFCNEAFPLS